MEQAVPPNAPEFRVKVDRGGLYGFRVVVVDRRGQHFPDRLTGTEPQTWVEVRLPKIVAPPPPPEAVKVELPVQPSITVRTDPEVPKIVTPTAPPVIDVRPAEQEPEPPAKPIIVADPTPEPTVEPTPEPKIVAPIAEPKLEPMAPVKPIIRSVTADPNDIRIKAVRPAKE